MTKHFYSNGKLLISAEYLVLDGVKALALPTKFGQDLSVKPISESLIYWNCYDFDGTKWFSETIGVKNIISNKTNKEDSSFLKTLIFVLHTAHRMNPVVFSKLKGYEVNSKLTFPRLWGLGTSSTWINNIAQWFEINAFHLLEESFGGSGYDIACAQNNTPITYARSVGDPLVVSVDFSPIFSDCLYFVYLNKKQNSMEAIANYIANKKNLQSQSKEIESITNKMLHSNTLVDFQILMEKHEGILSAILEQESVQKKIFPDFKGTIKSLGAWGGDFILVASQNNPVEYFKNKGYTTVLTYREMILDKRVE